jgi:signal transduction histidine kinase
VSRPWLLRRRITFAFGLTTLLLSLLLSLPFGALVLRSIAGEIDAIAREELEETRVHFAEQSPGPEEFAWIAADLSEDHPENPLAWRVWRADGTLFGDFGVPELLVHAPERAPTVATLQRPERALRVAGVELAGALSAVIVLDGTAQARRFRGFLGTALAFVLLATAAATLAGQLVGRRVSGLLAEVAANARTESAPETWAAPADSPEEIREVVRALQDTLRRIREESRNAHLLISGTAHELRSPLQNLLGETQVALLREREAGEYRRVLESHLEELGELSRMVDNLVTLAGLDEAQKRPTLEHFDLAAEARLRLSREQAFAARRGVELCVASQGELWIDGDRETLLLALRNVVTNAIEWSPSGKAVELRMGVAGDALEIAVDDAGPGVPPEERENIFRPFHRSAAARGRRVGFGLGLALTRSAVSAQGGTIEVVDSPLGGARFRIRLPVRRAA